VTVSYVEVEFSSGVGEGEEPVKIWDGTSPRSGAGADKGDQTRRAFPVGAKSSPSGHSPLKDILGSRTGHKSAQLPSDTRVPEDVCLALVLEEFEDVDVGTGWRFPKGGFLPVDGLCGVVSDLRFEGGAEHPRVDLRAAVS